MVSVKNVMATWTPLTVVPKLVGDAADGHVGRRGSETAKELSQHKRQEHTPGACCRSLDNVICGAIHNVTPSHCEKAPTLGGGTRQHRHFRLFLPAHLLPDEARLQPLLWRLQLIGCLDAAEVVEEAGDDARPTGLMAGPEAGSIVSVEVFVEQDQVTPMRILLELRGAPVHGAAPVVVPEKDAA